MAPDWLAAVSFQMWCRAETRAGLEAMLQKDSHSPNQFRVIGSLSNMAEFSETFQCPQGSRMNPVKKCVLWWAYTFFELDNISIFATEILQWIFENISQCLLIFRT